MPTINEDQKDQEVQSYLDTIIGNQAPKKEVKSKLIKEADEDDAGKEVEAQALQDLLFEQKQPQFEETLVDMQRVQVTAADKAAYLKAIMQDIPVRLDIKLCDDQVAVQVMSRSAFDQSMILFAAAQDIQNKIIPGDLQSYTMQLQKYAACCMLCSVGGTQFNRLVMQVPSTLNEGIQKAFYKRLVGARMLLIETMSAQRWVLCLNALRVFEAKMAIMAAEVVNGNFWKPEGMQ